MTTTKMIPSGKSWLARFVPLAIVGMLLGPIPFLLNPGLFWDDWVWKYTDPAEHIRIGRELGVWWAGYLSQAINGSDQTALISRLIAFVGWTAAAAGFAISFWARQYVPRREAFFLFLAVCVCHVAVIRFVESMAMANTYIASFWIGCALLACRGDRPGWRIASMVFFVFSFHLNSMLVMYGLVLVVLFLDMMPSSPAFERARREQVTAQLPGTAVIAELLTRARAVPGLVVEFLRKNFGFVSLPLVFIILIKIPSLVLTIFFTTKTHLYSDYNSVRPWMIFGAIPGTLLLAQELSLQYLGMLNSLRPQIFIALLAFYAVLLAILPKASEVQSAKNALLMVGVGAILVVFGIFPYVLVSKPPKLGDFYESRHILVAVPGIVLIWLSLFALIPALAPAKLFRLGRLIQVSLVACLLSAGTSSMILQGVDLFKDWMQQEAIEGFLRSNQREFSEFKTVVFDEAAGFRIGSRYIWNYEYTGALLAVFGGKERFGVSIQEYYSLPPNVSLLSLKDFRERYNIRDYDFSAPHLYLRVEDVPFRPRSLDLVTVAWKYWSSQDYGQKIGEYFRFVTAREFTEADQRIAEMRPVVSALIAAKRKVGYYPTFAYLNSGAEMLPQHAIGDHLLYSELNGIRQLGISFPRPRSDLSSGQSMPGQSTEPSFLYLSDGIDFKFLYVNAKDLPYAKQAYGSMVDLKRNGYGFWTGAAVNW
jgi:hypothetical protein